MEMEFFKAQIKSIIDSREEYRIKAGFQYIRKIPTGNPKRPFIYIYKDDSPEERRAKEKEARKLRNEKRKKPGILRTPVNAGKKQSISAKVVETISNFFGFKKKEDAVKQIDTDYKESGLKVDKKTFEEIYADYFVNKDKYDAQFNKAKEPKEKKEKKEDVKEAKEKKESIKKVPNIKNQVLKYLFGKYGNKQKAERTTSPVEQTKDESNFDTMPEVEKNKYSKDIESLKPKVEVIETHTLRPNTYKVNLSNDGLGFLSIEGEDIHIREVTKMKGDYFIEVSTGRIPESFFKKNNIRNKGGLSSYFPIPKKEAEEYLKSKEEYDKKIEEYKLEEKFRKGDAVDIKNVEIHYNTHTGIYLDSPDLPKDALSRELYDIYKQIDNDLIKKVNRGYLTFYDMGDYSVSENFVMPIDEFRKISKQNIEEIANRKKTREEKAEKEKVIEKERKDKEEKLAKGRTIFNINSPDLLPKNIFTELRNNRAVNYVTAEDLEDYGIYQQYGQWMYNEKSIPILVKENYAVIAGVTMYTKESPNGVKIDYENTSSVQGDNKQDIPPNTEPVIKPTTTEQRDDVKEKVKEAMKEEAANKPELKGSEKQIDWAEKIRDKAFSNFKGIKKPIIPPKTEKGKLFYEIYEKRLEIINNIENATFWIDFRTSSVDDLIQFLKPHDAIRGYKSVKEMPQKLRSKAIELEALIDKFKSLK